MHYVLLELNSEPDLTWRSSGKTSLLGAILRTITISSGRISLSNQDLADISPHTIRAATNAISQDPVFVAGSVRHNLTLWSTEPDDQNIVQVLKRVRLWDHFDRLGGLEIGLEPHKMLSYGQMQLFCLARAMLKEAKVLILDEATSR